MRNSFPKSILYSVLEFRDRIAPDEIFPGKTSRYNNKFPIRRRLDRNPYTRTHTRALAYAWSHARIHIHIRETGIRNLFNGRLFDIWTRNGGRGMDSYGFREETRPEARFPAGPLRERDIRRRNLAGARLPPAVFQKKTRPPDRRNTGRRPHCPPVIRVCVCIARFSPTCSVS